jgi:hypothetical protein
VDIFYTKELQFTEQAIETAIIQQLFDTYSYVNSSFGAIIHPEEIEATIRRVPGVTNARVVNLYREEDSAARGILIGNPNELFVFLYDNISVAALSADATLTSLVPSVGTLSPSFNVSFGSYSLAVPNGTTSLTLTATSTSSAAVIRAGSTTYASGAAIPVTVAVGTTDFEILVTAADGITFKEYVVTITRAS